MLRIPNPVSVLAGGVPKYVFLKVDMIKFNSDKIRTSPQPGPKNAWIGDPHHRNCMVEAGTGSFHVKVHPEKKP